MKIEQVAQFTNEATRAILGETAVVNQDLSNIVDIGRQITNLDSWRNKFLEQLVNRIGRWHYVNRIYDGNVPSIYMDAWEYGSILAKFWGKLKQAEDNPSWELTDGMDYSMNVYHAEELSARFWNMMTTHEVEYSIVDRQFNDSFNSAEEHAAFVSMIMTNVRNTLNIKNEALVMATIRNFIGLVLNAGQPLQKVNLLSQYNTAHNASLTPTSCLEDAEFIRFAIVQMQLYSRRLSKYTTLFNIGAQERFTPKDRLRVIYLDDFRTRVGAYLYNAPQQFSRDFLDLPMGDSVPFWQSPGTDYSFTNISSIKATVRTETVGTNATVSQSGILAVMSDQYAMAVCNEHERTLAHYVKKAEFTNYCHKRDARYMNDPNENGVVFYVAS